MGSCVLNVYRYLADYTPGKTPQFIEGHTFKMIVPLNEQVEVSNTSSADYMRVIRTSLNEVASHAVKDRLIEIGRIIANTPGIKVKGIEEAVPSASQRTLKRDLKVLAEKGLIEYRGSARGYYPLIS